MGLELQIIYGAAIIIAVGLVGWVIACNRQEKASPFGPCPRCGVPCNLEECAAGLAGTHSTECDEIGGGSNKPVCP